MLKVTSADGKIEVTYELDLDLTTADKVGVSQIRIYPNPATDMLNVSGIGAGNRIRVFNTSGINVYDIQARSNVEMFSLAKQPAGMYLIVVSSDEGILGRFKAIKK